MPTALVYQSNGNQIVVLPLEGEVIKGIPEGSHVLAPATFGGNPDVIQIDISTKMKVLKTEKEMSIGEIMSIPGIFESIPKTFTPLNEIPEVKMEETVVETFPEEKRLDEGQSC